jgi:hypothetical protein
LSLEEGGDVVGDRTVIGVAGVVEFGVLKGEQVIGVPKAECKGVPRRDLFSAEAVLSSGR